MSKYWKKIKTRNAYKGKHWTIIKNTYKFPDGNINELEIAVRKPSACVFALTKDKKVILTKQYRPGPKKVYFELPGGMVDKGEDIKHAVQREMREETGYAGDFKYIGMNTIHAYSTAEIYYFIATNCRKIQKQKLGKDEYIEVIKVSLDTFRKYLQEPRISEVAGGYMALDYLELL